MRRVFCILLCIALLLPAFALADKTVTITFTGDVTLGRMMEKAVGSNSFV